MNRDEIAKKLLGGYALDVTTYLDEIGFRKNFRTEESFLKAVEKELESECKNSPEFQEITGGDVRIIENMWHYAEAVLNNKQRAEVILNYIRLLRGKSIWEIVTEELFAKDADEPSDFFSVRDQEHEEWSFL